MCLYTAKLSTMQIEGIFLGNQSVTFEQRTKYIVKAKSLIGHSYIHEPNNNQLKINGIINNCIAFVISRNIHTPLSVLFVMRFIFKSPMINWPILFELYESFIYSNSLQRLVVNKIQFLTEVVLVSCAFYTSHLLSTQYIYIYIDLSSVTMNCRIWM